MVANFMINARGLGVGVGKGRGARRGLAGATLEVGVGWLVFAGDFFAVEGFYRGWPGETGASTGFSIG